MPPKGALRGDIIVLIGTSRHDLHGHDGSFQSPGPAAINSHAFELARTWATTRRCFGVCAFIVTLRRRRPSLGGPNRLTTTAVYDSFGVWQD